MKRKVSLLLFSLSCVTQLVASNDISLEKYSKAVAKFVQFDNPPAICCARGERGPRGKRGQRGKDVTSLAERFINAPMMTWFDDGVFPPNAIVIPYANGIQGTNIPTWVLFPSTGENVPVGANFVVPIDLDVTKPVTAVIHMLVDSSTETGNQATLQIQADYQPSGALLGSTAPATGFADTEISADFTVPFVTPSPSANMVQISVPVTLDPTKMAPGDWAFMAVGRIAPAANEYSGVLYLSTISIQYTRLNS